MAGGGTGYTPCAILTVPEPTLSGEATKRSTSSQPRPITAPTTSTIESTAPDFVEGDLLDVDAVNAGLRLAQPAEQHGRALLHPGIEAARLDHAQDLAQAPVRMGVVGLIVVVWSWSWS